MKTVPSILPHIFTLAALLYAGASARAQVNVPRSPNAPKVGAIISDFTLADSAGKPVRLSELLSTPLGEHKQPWVLVIFYRGYW